MVLVMDVNTEVEEIKHKYCYTSCFQWTAIGGGVKQPVKVLNVKTMAK